MDTMDAVQNGAAVMGLDPLRRLAQSDLPSAAWSDDRLIQECLRGNEQAWSVLIDKYKNLIYSVPIKYRASQEDAADIFQAVCLDLFNELPRLRKAGALASWLITVATHKCFHWRQKEKQLAEKESADWDTEAIPDPVTASPALIVELEREQMVREAVAQLPSRCQEMVRLLFYEDPPLPYAEVAQLLGLATGSIGFIRGRCLKRLQQLLKEMDF